MKYASKLFVVFCLLAGLCGTIVSCAPTKKAADETTAPAVEEETAPADEAAAPATEETGTATEAATTTEAAQ
ncbi:MAG: hypothetical protein AAB110_06945 [Candidatus Desantisbacteria bacterium]